MDTSNQFKVTATRVPGRYAFTNPQGSLSRDEAMNLAMHLIVAVGGEEEIPLWLAAIKNGET